MYPFPAPKILLLILLLPSICLPGRAQEVPLPRFQLTPQPWQAMTGARETALDAIEGICRVAVGFQDSSGAIIDPFVQREFQYATPYIACAIGVLNHFGRGQALLPAGIRAMEHATACFAAGSGGIPDAHGEFFIASLTHALEVYRDHVPEAIWLRWESRMKTPLLVVMAGFEGRLNNWRAYAMNGEWLRAQHGLVDKDSARQFIETCWHTWTQRERMAGDAWHMYQDWSSDPQSLTVEAVGRGNLASLLAQGYDGPSAAEMWHFVRTASQATLLLQSPAGQCPSNGRTDDHVFGDVLYHLIFKVMAQDALAQGAARLSGQYTRASLLSLQSIARWQRGDAPWAGSFSITKNHFDPGARVGYQPASQWSNYSGAMAYHLGEALMIDPEETLPQAPAPAETGGYALQSDPMFSVFAANAGGMQVLVNLRGASVPKYGYAWTTLGAVRFSKSGWDDRLGPSDGENYVRDASPAPENTTNAGRQGASFAPAWLENGQWQHMADQALHYQATPAVTFVHPLLVKFSLTYRYVTGGGGPYFRQEFTVTPEGILTKSYCLQARPFAVTVPLLSNDGRPLAVRADAFSASTRYTQNDDEQHFVNLNPNVNIHLLPDSIQSTYGWLRTARFEAAAGDTVQIFIYPRKAADPGAEVLRTQFRLLPGGFSTSSATVRGNTYVSVTAAGGEGTEIDLDGDGQPDVRFEQPCRFLMQLDKGRITAIEADQEVVMHYGGERWELEVHSLTPIRISSDH